MESMMKNVRELCQYWKLLQWSREKVIVAAVVLPIFFTALVNLPLLVLAATLWIIYRRFRMTVESFISILMRAATATIAKPKDIRATRRALSRAFNGDEESATNGLRILIPGSNALPYLGETVSFLADPQRFLANHQAQYGSVFVTNLDFSGTLLAARRVVCVIQLPEVHWEKTRSKRPPTYLIPTVTASPASPAKLTATVRPDRTSRSPSREHSHIPAPTTTGASGATRRLQVLGYAGLYGNSCYGGVVRRTLLPALAQRILADDRHLDRWEDCATPIIQSFLRRLVYEGATFDLSERISRLACELIGVIFLNMPGYSASLHLALDEYLHKCATDPAIGASTAQRKHLQSILQIAVNEENRRYLARDFQDYDADSMSQEGGGAVGMLTELLDACDEVVRQHGLGEGTAVGGGRSDLQRDLLFVLVVEVLYPTLRRQLCTLASAILRDRTAPTATTTATSSTTSAAHAGVNLPTRCRESYTAYLAARRLVGNVSGSGLARFSWSSTLYPESGEQQAVEDEATGERDTPPMVHTHAVQERQSQQQHVGMGGGQSSIGAFLLSQLSWPLSPVSTASAPAGPLPASAVGIAATREPMAEYTAGRTYIASGSTQALRRGVESRSGQQASRGGLPVALSCDAFAVSSSSSSESGDEGDRGDGPSTALDYSSSSASGRQSGNRQRSLHRSHPPQQRTAALLEPHTSPAVMQRAGRGLSRVTPPRSAPHTPASTASGRRSGGREGRWGLRRTPGKSGQGAGYSVVTPGRPFGRSAGDQLWDRPGTIGPVAMALHLKEEPVSAGSSAANSPSRTSWRYRERLIIQYVTAIKDLVAYSRVVTDAISTPQLPQMTLSQCRQNTSVACPAAEGSAAHYTLHKGDLVLQVYPTNAHRTAAADTDTQSAEAADASLGLFSELVLSIFAHELVTGYTWDLAPTTTTATTTTTTTSTVPLHSYQVIHREPAADLLSTTLQAVAAVCAVCFPQLQPPPSTKAAHSRSPCAPPALMVRKFSHSPDSIAFMVAVGRGDGVRGGWQDLGSEGEGGGEGWLGGGVGLEVGEGGHWGGMGEGEELEEDERYFSDGL